MEKNWYALYVNSRAEKKIAESLKAKGFEAYVPIVKTMRQWSDRKKMVELPLMNGYVFLKIAPNENEKVRQIKGVVNFVRSEGKIAVIQDFEIERLKQLVEFGYQLEVSTIDKKYKEGDRIKISSGPLKGIEGFVVEDRDNKQIEVLLESIGQCIRVKLPKGILISLI